MIIVSIILAVIFGGVCHLNEWREDILITGLVCIGVTTLALMGVDTVGELLGWWTITLNY